MSEIEDKNRWSRRYVEKMKSPGFWKPAAGVVGGALAGFLYYYFIGCNSGTCAITSSPVMSSLFGASIGFFLLNSPCSRNQC